MNKPFRWNPDKNDLLKRERGFGFEDVVEAIDSGALLDDVSHPSERYPNQRMFVVDLDNYAVVVPFVEEEDYVFLKTAFPSRQATRKYLK